MILQRCKLRCPMLWGGNHVYRNRCMIFQSFYCSLVTLQHCQLTSDIKLLERDIIWIYFFIEINCRKWVLQQEAQGPHHSPEQYFLYLIRILWIQNTLLKYCTSHKYPNIPRLANQKQSITIEAYLHVHILRFKMLQLINPFLLGLHVWTLIN